MSFYTSLTGLQAATTELSVTSNNIANAGTSGFKRADADFGDIFASTPLQKAGSIAGSGVALNGITQQHTQGNIEFSTNSLDLAITGDGYFKLKTTDGLLNGSGKTYVYMSFAEHPVVASNGDAGTAR